MSVNTIGNPPVVEKMDVGRGDTGNFAYSNAKRRSATVGSFSQVANDKARDSSNMKKPVSDPRLT